MTCPLLVRRASNDYLRARPASYAASRYCFWRRLSACASVCVRVCVCPHKIWKTTDLLLGVSNALKPSNFIFCVKYIFKISRLPSSFKVMELLSKL